MTYQNRTTLFIFLDESGNFDFSTTGTKYWSLSALCTFDPAKGREAFVDLLYQVTDEGQELESFHASEDSQMIRDAVFARTMQLPDEFEIHSVIAEKAKCNPALYTRRVMRKGIATTIKDPSEFYDRVCRTLLKYIMNSPKCAQADKIVVVLSSIFTNDRHQAMKQTLKGYLKKHTAKPFELHFRQTKADINCQLADYCGWAIAIKWERGEMRSYDIIKNRVQSEYPIFKSGTKLFY